ncbi:MAG: glycerol-3-phosphate 1-O-acyltransferase PlsY [Clostridiaceae bacterium]|nr:glycerol-3-phosphate 1-O-acyltransferase PlsY [Clostridiaceae bacterium]
MIVKIVLAAIIGYLLGSVNTSIIVGKLFFRTDIRKHGSGNAGATNTLRTLGKGAAIAVVAGDFLKGALACIIGRYLAGELMPGVYAGEYLGGMFAVIGHNWPVYFGFKGGKGVMTSFAIVMFFSPVAALICLGAFILTVALTRYVSLGSMIASALFPLVVFLLGEPLLMIVVSIILALLIIMRHNSNIKRLLEGNEKKITFRRKQ